MNDVVAVAVVLPNGEHRYFITWGRIQHIVDPAPLEALVLRFAGRFSGCQDAVSARVCETLREAEDGPEFYEALVSFGQRSVPWGEGYEDWVQRIGERMANGRELYYLGDPSRSG